MLNRFDRTWSDRLYNKKKRFKITLRGIHALGAYNKMDELLVEKQVSKKMESEYFDIYP
jgi:hypothetical protein